MVLPFDPPIEKAITPTQQSQPGANGATDRFYTGQPDIAKDTVREFMPSANPWGIQGDVAFAYMPRDIISPWYTLACDYELRSLFYNPHAWMMMGAVNLFIQNVLSTPYEISGGRNQTFKWQDIFYESDFGEGYDYCFSKVILDVLTMNRGGFVGLSAYGDPDEPLEEGAQVTGIYHLDALRTVPTGNYDYPFIYYSEYTGKLHRLHRTRVIRIVDMPSADTRRYGMGASALYRALSIANAQILLGKHQNEMLNDLPPPGLVVFSNVKPNDATAWMNQYSADRVRDAEYNYAPIMQISSSDPEKPAKVEFVSLSQVPEGFNYKEFIDIHVNATALALSVDPQDIWPLTGQALGTGTQSKILESKARGKGYGYLLKKLERILNGIMPRGLEFKFKYKDEEQGLQQATIAQTWVEVVQAASVLSEKEKRQLLANQIGAFADVLLDENGNVRLPDDDPKEPAAETPAQLAAQNMPAETDMTAQSQTPTPTAAEATPQDEEVTADDNVQKAWKRRRVALIRKDYNSTKESFTDDIRAIIADATEGSISKTTFSARMRSTLTKYGKLAYLDGLNEGGVETDELDEDGQSEVATILAANSGYVSDLATSIYNDKDTVDADARAPLWANKSLSDFYAYGLMSADSNGMYEWQLGSTEEHCADCLAMNGQRHRLKDYASRDLIPPTRKTKCGGWRCDCGLEKTKGRAKGSWI